MKLPLICQTFSPAKLLSYTVASIMVIRSVEWCSISCVVHKRTLCKLSLIYHKCSRISLHYTCNVTDVICKVTPDTTASVEV